MPEGPVSAWAGLVEARVAGLMGFSDRANRLGMIDNDTGVRPSVIDCVRPLRLAFLMILAIPLGACIGPRVVYENGALAASPRPCVVDIPLPVGFVLVDQSSEDWSSASVRYLRHRYRGRTDKYDVRAFYSRQMPLVRWTPISDMAAGGRISMYFERDNESCTILIEDEPGGLVSRVAVEVTIAPLTQRPP